MTITMTYEDAMNECWSTIANDIVPRLKPQVDPLDILLHMIEQMSSPQQGVAMRIGMLESMLNMEARMPKGMSLTRKAAGGSPTASIKREFGLKKGLSKAVTADIFSALVDIAQFCVNNHVDVFEFHDFSTMHRWDEESDDGSFEFSPTGWE